MKDEIKEIINQLEIVARKHTIEVCDDGNIETMPANVIDELRLNNYSAKLLLDYITNLQTIEQQYSAILSENAELENKITNLQEENERLKKLKERYQLEKEDYKIRNEKAIEYIEEKDLTNNANFMDDGVGYLFEDIINLLQGKSDE